MLLCKMNLLRNVRSHRENKLKATVMLVTPAMAKEWLKRNLNNREIRPTGVKRWIDIMQAGEWKLHHQGIAFDTNNVLVDGQHRLEAIAQSGVSVKMLVTRGVDPASVSAMDQGIKRTPADILKQNKKVAELVNTAARIMVSKTSPTPTELEAMFDAVGEDALELQQALSSNTAYVTTAPFRLAAVVQIRRGANKDYVHKLYGDLCRSDVEELPPVGNALVRARLKATPLNSHDINQVLAVGLYVFDPANKNKSRLNINGIDAGEVVRSTLRPGFNKAMK